MRISIGGVVLTLALSTGCALPPQSFNSESAITDNTPLTMNFAAEDENKIEIRTSFPTSNQTTVADESREKVSVHRITGEPCFSFGGLNSSCRYITVTRYSNQGCMSEESFTNTFDNTEQPFYARRFDNWAMTGDDVKQVPVCSADTRYAKESFLAEFVRKKNGKVLTYSIVPSKRVVESKWQNMTLLPMFADEGKKPTTEKELAEVNARSFKYAYLHPVDLNKVFGGNVVEINYGYGFGDITTKYDPVSMINLLRKKIGSDYSVNISDARYDCHDLTFERKNHGYKFTTDVKMCRINNTQSSVVIKDPHITITGRGTVDLTGLSGEMKKLESLFK